MPDYTLTFAGSARKELEKFPSQVVARIFAKIESLPATPRPPGCQKLRGNNALWRIRVGDYRVRNEIDDAARIVDLVGVGNRRDVCRN